MENVTLAIVLLCMLIIIVKLVSTDINICRFIYMTIQRKHRSL